MGNPEGLELEGFRLFDVCGRTVTNDWLLPCCCEGAAAASGAGELPAVHEQRSDRSRAGGAAGKQPAQPVPGGLRRCTGPQHLAAEKLRGTAAQQLHLLLPGRRPGQPLILSL